MEQKNGSIVRGLFGEARADAFELRDQPAPACTEWSDYFNYRRPCIMITRRAKKDRAKGFGKRYDKPRLPAQRVLDANVAGNAREAQIQTRIEKTNGIGLCRFVLRSECRPQSPRRFAPPLRGRLLLPTLTALNPEPYGVLAFDEFTYEAKSLRCLFYFT